ncbi:hypothetical protein [Paenibacillus sp. FSL K6-1318]
MIVIISLSFPMHSPMNSDSRIIATVFITTAIVNRNTSAEAG